MAIKGWLKSVRRGCGKTVTHQRSGQTPVVSAEERRSVVRKGI